MDSESTSKQSDRRQATVVFADISGFTALSEIMDPEDMAQTMDDCFHVCERIIIERGGVVDKFIGDCVMALFGAPKALEAAPRQAVNAAIAIRSGLKRFNVERKLPRPLGCHIGINTGLVVAGDVGGDVKRDYTVMGPTVNLAARLEGQAVEGEIFVGPVTHRYIADEFEFAKVKPLKLKGIDQPVQAYSVVTDDEYVHDARAADRARSLDTPMVGRTSELATLRGALEDLARGRGGILTLEADNGLGKSRLLAEAHRLKISSTSTVLEGRCLSIGSTLSYHPFIDLLEAWADVPPDAASNESLGILERRLRDLEVAEPEAVFAFLATMMGREPGPDYASHLQGLEPEALATMIQKSLRRVIERISAESPLVVIVEDLQWADGSSISALESLLQLAAKQSILFILAFRPEHESTSGRVLAAIRERFSEIHTHMELQPLEPRECLALIRALLGSDEFPEQLAAVVKSKAGGNPLYIEEVVRSLVDAGALVERHNRLVATSELRDVEIHGSIEEVLMARVDRLPHEAREVLQRAAVIGRRFHRSVLEELLVDKKNDEGFDLDMLLALLEERHLLGKVTSRATANVKRRTLSVQEGYFFHNGLAQQMLYESLLKRTRRDLHAKCAEAIERIFADRLHDFWGMLAYHFTRADNFERAEGYLLKAGEGAASAAASAEALHFFREAYRVYLLIHGDGGDDETKAVLEKNIAMALLNTGNLSESIEHFNAALRLYGEAMPETDRAMYLKAAFDLPAVLLGLYRGKLGREGKGKEKDRDLFAVMYNRCRAQNIVDAERSFFDNIAAIRHLSHLDPTDVENATGIFASAGSFFAFAGLPFGISRRFFRLTEELSAEKDAEDRFQHHTMEFVLHFHEGDWSDEHDVDDELFEHGLRHGLLWNADVYLGLNCERNIRQGRFELAEKQIARLAELGDEWGYSFARSNQLAMTAALLLEKRCFPEAHQAAQRYHEFRYEDTLHLLALSWRAKAEIIEGNLDQGTETLEAASRVFGHGGQFPPFYLGAYRTACLLRDLHEVERGLAEGEKPSRALKRRATASLKSALAIAPKIAREMPEALRLAARLHWRLGRTSAAVKAWTAALADGERMRVMPELGRLYRDLGECLSTEGASLREFSGEDADAWTNKARTTFEELGLEWEQDRMESGRTFAQRAA